MKKRSRSSARIALVLVGVGGTLVACSPEPEIELTRDLYRSLDDCAADWGQPEACDASVAALDPNDDRGGNSGVRQFHSYYVGPNYQVGYRGQAQADAWGDAHRLGRSPAPGTMLADRSIGHTPRVTQRGGFGASGSRFSGGG